MMQTPTPKVEAVLERFDAVTREAMIQLSRWKGEREEWHEERAELHRALKRTSSQDVRLMVIPLQATLQRAIGRIDRLLGEPMQVRP